MHVSLDDCKVICYIDIGLSKDILQIKTIRDDYCDHLVNPSWKALSSKKNKPVESTFRIKMTEICFFRVHGRSSLLNSWSQRKCMCVIELRFTYKYVQIHVKGYQVNATPRRVEHFNHGCYRVFAVNENCGHHPKTRATVNRSDVRIGLLLYR